MSSNRNVRIQEQTNIIILQKKVRRYSFILKLLSLGVTFSVVFSIGFYAYSTNIISSQSQSIASLQTSIAQKNQFIGLQNSTIVSQQNTINALQNSSSVRAYNLLKDQLTTTQAQLQSIQKQLDDAKSTIANLTAVNTQLRQQISTLQTQLSTVTAQRDRLQHIIDTYWVSVSGRASTNAYGTSPIWIYFYANGMRFGAPVTNNVYSIRLPNNSTYSIFIHWVSSVNQDVCDTHTNFAAQGDQTSYTLSNVSC